MDIQKLPPQLREMYEKLRKQNEDGTDQDMIPGGTGAFGWTITNPVPTDTLIGSMIYLSRLRTTDGAPVSYERMGSNETPGIQNPIDLYALSVDGAAKGILYISPYHRKNSILAPEGFKII